jgi:prevent-host-death family protein
MAEIDVPPWAESRCGVLAATSSDLDFLVRLTRNRFMNPPRKTRSQATQPPGRWRLHEAKARFSELVRRVRSEGPQHVTVHGRDEVVVLAAEEFRRLTGDATGEALIQALQASPFRDTEIEPARDRMPVRDVGL